MKPVHSLPGLAVTREGTRAVIRALPEEVPVAVSFDGTTLAVMMCSPADIADFAHGFALSEGVIDRLGQIESFEVVEHPNGIEARFWLAGDRSEALKARRRQMTGPVGCGLCGIDSLDEALRPLPHVGQPAIALTRAEIAAATETLRGHQPLHDQTRAVHAAGFLRPGEGLVLAREDVGRHNALDKLIGALARGGSDASAGAIVLTSRVSVEMVQKAAMARSAVIIAASAPTAHALRLAEEAGITLAAFARAGGFDLYSHPDRIDTGDAHVA
ncbi:formate dehydrogenase accessory sulfurtransferase FdhD [Sinisalibacter aestuarii]|uniref:Sulfur carrier protein FdhD n=1 Tax=Sinisalibacter aestuarii TaxID=2949426 RepID=A0ABQ5LVS8_9RHOB|nr:formate dehydrogenase accessory sulfurtransferase FdhD [Sinisalibacter aestuarii]GKY89104.1 sulfurtransferase FdhD [Sinisalibacter aestuarii]